MTKTFIAAAMILLLAPSAALAQHRGGDAALGALSGAVVLGPVGAVAGAVIGYTAGPAIARSWGFNRSSGPPPRQRRQASKDERAWRESGGHRRWWAPARRSSREKCAGRDLAKRSKRAGAGRAAIRTGRDAIGACTHDDATCATLE